MIQKYLNGEKVVFFGIVIVLVGGEVLDIKKVVFLVFVNDVKIIFYYIDFSFDNFKLGGLVFVQLLGKVGSEVFCVQDVEYFCDVFLVV